MRFYSLLAVLCTVATGGLLAQEATDTSREASQFFVDSLDRKVFLGKKYSYTVEISVLLEEGTGRALSRDSEDMLAGERELLVGSMQGTLVPSRITHSILNPGECHLSDERIITCFAGFDGKETRRYFRRLIHDFTGSPVEGRGVVQSAPVFDHVYSDPLFRTLFQSFMGPMKGVPDHLDVVHYPDIRIRRMEDARFGSVVELSTVGSELVSLYTDAPEYLPLRVYQGNKELGGVVNELVEIDGIRYPKSGWVSSRSWRGEFTLNQVEECDAKLEGWFDAWPNGTLVSKMDDDETALIPYTPEELEKIEECLTRNRSKDQSSVNSRGGRKMFLLVNLAIMCIAVVVLLLRRKPV